MSMMPVILKWDNFPLSNPSSRSQNKILNTTWNLSHVTNASSKSIKTRTVKYPNTRSYRLSKPMPNSCNVYNQRNTSHLLKRSSLNICQMSVTTRFILILRSLTCFGLFSISCRLSLSRRNIAITICIHSCVHFTRQWDLTPESSGAY